MSSLNRPYNRNSVTSIKAAFQRSPAEALELVLQNGEDSLYGNAHIYTSYDMVGGGRAGSYQTVTRASLESRSYTVELVNDAVAIYFTDVLYNMRTHSYVPTAGHTDLVK